MRLRAKILVGIAAAAAVAFGGYWGLKRGHRNAIVATVVQHLSLRPVSILVLGRQAEQLSPLTDSMMLAAINPRTHKMGLLSIPRDLWVDIPGHGYARINEAFMDGGGPLAERVVQQVTGVRPDYYLMINYAGFTKLIDDVGGVTVDVKHAINDPTYPAPDECCGHYAPLHIPAGVQHMDGKTALAFMRERHDLPLGDLSREQDQQEVLLALKRQVLRPGSALHVPTLLSDLRGTFQTDFPLEQAAGYAAAASLVSAADIRHAVLQYDNNAVTGWQTPAGADVLLPHEGAIAKVVQDVFGGILPDIQAPTEAIDPMARLAPTPPKPPQPAQRPAGPKLRFVVPAGGAGVAWYAPLWAGSPVVARLQELLVQAVPAGRAAAAVGGEVLLALDGGPVEHLQASGTKGTVLIGGKPFSDPALYAYLPQVQRQATLVTALAVQGSVYAPGSPLRLSGNGWIGPRVALSLVPAAPGGRPPIPLGSAPVAAGRFAWSGSLPKGLPAGAYRLHAQDGVRANDLLLVVR